MMRKGPKATAGRAFGMRRKLTNPIHLTLNGKSKRLEDLKSGILQSFTCVWN